MKDASVVAVVDQLRSRFGADALLVVDHWEADRCAIGLSRPDEPERLVYVCTFGKPPGRYDVSLELPPARGDDFPYTPAGDRSDLDFGELATVVGEHLGLR